MGKNDTNDVDKIEKKVLRKLDDLKRLCWFDMKICPYHTTVEGFLDLRSSCDTCLRFNREAAISIIRTRLLSVFLEIKNEGQMETLKEVDKKIDEIMK
jgi:hypothetical protein